MAIDENFRVKKTEKSDGRPRYRLTERAYIDDRIYDPELQARDEEGDLKPLYITYDGAPGHHMEPANAAAEAMYKKHPPVFIDPIRELQIIGAAKKEEKPLGVEDMASAFAAALSRFMPSFSPSVMASEFPVNMGKTESVFPLI